MWSEASVIFSAKGPQLCLGVRNPAPGAPVELMNPNGAPTGSVVWYFDPDSGLIRLHGVGELVLDVAETIMERTTLFTVTKITPGRLSQHWNWTKYPGMIVNVLTQNLAVDDTGSPRAGVRPWLWSASTGNNNQKWSIQKTPKVGDCLDAAFLKSVQLESV